MKLKDYFIMANNITLTDMRKNLRLMFQDKYAVQWSDDLLDEIIYEAMREYAFYSRRLIASCDITSGQSAIIRCPDDFIAAEKVIGVDGREIPIVSYRRLATVYGDFRKITGDTVKCVCFDFDGHGFMRVFPQITPEKLIGKMYYSRLPLSFDWSVKNMEAVKTYALFMMFSFAGKAQAQNHYERFIELVNSEKVNTVLRGNERSIRTGRFF